MEEEKTKLEWDKFEPFFGTWASKLKPFFMKGGFNPIYEFLKFESKRGKRIAPSSFNTYRAFLETPLTELRCVLLSYCPYHTFINGAPVADGLAFSCGITGKQQPSLTKFIEGLENDVYNGLNLNYNKDMADLTYLAKEGVLLWNCALTAEQNKAGSHQEIWAPFTKYVLEECLAYTGVPIIFIGKDAQQFKRYVSPLTHGHIFEIEHPSFAARNQQEWETKGAFKKVTEIVRQNTGHVIDWLNERPPF